MSFDPISYAMGAKASGGGGGGNPNYIETIKGTLANPWGNYTMVELRTMHVNKTATVYITTPDAPNQPYYPRFVSATGLSSWFRCTHAAGDAIGIDSLNYGPGGLTMAYSRNYINGTYTEEAIDPTTPCTLTIIHHPLTGALMPAETQTFGGDA